MREYFRKQLVYLKKRPQVIPLLFIIIAMCVFTFKMPVHSGVITKIANGKVAPWFFVTTVCSIMSLALFLGYKKKFDKGAIFSVSLTLVLLVVQFAAQFYYFSVLNKEELRVTDINVSTYWTVIHIVFLGLAIASIALLPLYKKLLQKINTTPKSQLDMLNPTKTNPNG